ncbi:MAG TPA: NAD(P)H-binding protein [Solirubrobacteraceae bacterium]|nr:NAD(P)H-binding protein [Solirubrobacteraceae bacterium]
MRVAVVGATGRIGRLTVEALERRGHETVGISRSQGVDVYTGDGLETALAGVDAVVDASSCSATDRDEAVEFFSRSTRNLLEAERAAGVQHHVLLSIIGLTRVTGNAHYAGKRAQEEVLERGPVPWSIVPATHFHDFAEMVTTWTERDGSATIAPLLIQPVAPADVADVLAEVATGPPQGRCPDLAGPEPQDLVDLARRTRAARGTPIRLVPTWSGVFGVDMAGDVLLPELDARIARTTFDDWLAGETRSR